MVTDSVANKSQDEMIGGFDAHDNGRILEAAKAAQKPINNSNSSNNKCVQLQMQFFQKVLNESISNRWQLFLEIATAL